MDCIDLNTDIAYLKNKYKKEKVLLLQLCNNLTENDIFNLIKKHLNQNYTDALFQIITTYSTTTENILKFILEINQDKSEGIINAVLTSGKAQEKIIEPYLHHRSKEIQEHAKLAHLKHSLSNLNEHSLAVLLHEIETNKYSFPEKYIIATFKNIPVKVLDLLKNDTSEIIAEEALNNLKDK